MTIGLSQQARHALVGLLIGLNIAIRKCHRGRRLLMRSCQHRDWGSLGYLNEGILGKVAGKEREMTEACETPSCTC